MGVCSPCDPLPSAHVDSALPGARRKEKKNKRRLQHSAALEAPGRSPGERPGTRGVEKRACNSGGCFRGKAYVGDGKRLGMGGGLITKHRFALRGSRQHFRNDACVLYLSIRRVDRYLSKRRGDRQMARAVQLLWRCGGWKRRRHAPSFHCGRLVECEADKSLRSLSFMAPGSFGPPVR